MVRISKLDSLIFIDLSNLIINTDTTIYGGDALEERKHVRMGCAQGRRLYSTLDCMIDSLTKLNQNSCPITRTWSSKQLEVHSAHI
jgi:hypothetical protein